MPKRKVIQTVILYRNGERVKPAIGSIFDFTADEVAQLAQVAPEALARPIIEVDAENLEAQQKAEAEAAKQEAPAKVEDKATKGGKAGKGNAADDEV